jgi:DNA mismatch endonuclease (patch repair protein)
MTDIYSKNKRSKIMSKIFGKETKYEILVRKFLFEKGFRYRKNDKRLPGRPDIVLPKYKTRNSGKIKSIPIWNEIKKISIN